MNIRARGYNNPFVSNGGFILYDQDFLGYIHVRRFIRSMWPLLEKLNPASHLAYNQTFNLNEEGPTTAICPIYPFKPSSI